MASSLGAMSSLIKAFGLLEIPKSDQEQLASEYGIKTHQDLVSKRENLARSRNVSYRLAVAAVDYIAERRKKLPPPHDDAAIHKLFEPSKSLSDSWEVFLARKILKARNGSQLMQLAKTDVKTRNTKEAGKRLPVPLQNQKGYSKGMQYWEDIKNDVLMEEPVDDVFQQEELLGIAGNDSPWKLDSIAQEVFLAAAPELIRLPVPVFQGLYSFQRVGVAWMASLYLEEKGGILGDEMGMGKTRQTLVFLLGLMSAGTIRNALIVCPKSTLDKTWKDEVTKLISMFCWKHKKAKVVMAVTGKNKSERQRLQVLQMARNCSEKEPHLVITSYPQVQRSKRGFIPGQSKLGGLGYFEYVILDEAHRNKTRKSIQRKNLDAICKRSNKLLLTGTPILNRLEELHSLLMLAVPDDFDEWPQFNVTYARPIEAMRKPLASAWETKRGKEVNADLQMKLKPFLIQRQKKHFPEIEVPPSREFDVWTRLTPTQRQLYSEFVKDGKVIERLTNKDERTCVFPFITKLRALCNHPLLLDKTFQDGKQAIQLTLEAVGKEKLVADSPKLGILLGLLHKWRADGLKVLVFSLSVRMLDIIQYVLDGTAGMQVCRIDGSTTGEKRKSIVTDFNKATSQKNIMLLSLKAGGEGLTLTGANKSVLFDPTWNMASSDQAVARTVRPGQTKECECIHLLSAGTVEEKMFGKQMYKGGVEDEVLGNRSKGFSIKSYDKDELTKLFELEADGVCESFDISQKTQGGASSIKDCSISKDHRSILGVSRRNANK